MQVWEAYHEAATQGGRALVRRRSDGRGWTQPRAGVMHNLVIEDQDEGFPQLLEAGDDQLVYAFIHPLHPTDSITYHDLFISAEDRRSIGEPRLQLGNKIFPESAAKRRLGISLSDLGDICGSNVGNHGKFYTAPRGSMSVPLQIIARCQGATGCT